MRSVKQDSTNVSKPADKVFEAALGVAQNTKNINILAVHNAGRILVLREASKMSNPKFLEIRVTGDGDASALNIAVGTDPRTQAALLDGRANGKSLKKFVEGVQGALDGSTHAPVDPVADHYLQKQVEVPWEDPAQPPDIVLDGNFKAVMFSR